MRSNRTAVQKRFIRFMREKLVDVKKYDSPMALYEWFVVEWGKPLSNELKRQAYMAAWAFSIDKGMVKL